MKRSIATIYATILSTLCAVGFFVAFFFSFKVGVWEIVSCGLGAILSFILVPSVHEWGHILFGKMKKMRLVFTKFSIFRLVEDGGKLRFSFASPFLPDETQMIPKCGGKMKSRTLCYARGGLVCSGLFACTVLLCALLFTHYGIFGNYFFFGILPYAAYLFLLNVAPFYYASGKTDGLIVKGIKKGDREEESLVFAMEIFGQMQEGKSFGEIDETLFDFPVVAEDTPIFAVATDLKYRRALELGDLESASKHINRLAVASPYLSDAQMGEVAMELLYMHSLYKDEENAKKTLAICEDVLSKESATTKRIYTAYYRMLGDDKKAETCKQEGIFLLAKESLLGKRKAEEILLQRL